MVKLSFFISWMRPLRNYFQMTRKLVEFVTKTLEMMGTIVDEHKNPESHEVVDYIDAYLKEIKNTHDPSSSFCGDKGGKVFLSRIVSSRNLL